MGRDDRSIPRSFRGDGAEIRTLAFSHDGRTLVAGCDGHAFRLDARTALPVGVPLEPHEAYVWEAEFNRDDTRLLTLAGDEYRKSGRLQVWDAETGLRRASPTDDLLVLPAAAFHPDGRLIATGDWEGKARLWDATSGTRVGPVLREPVSVHALAFSPDGRTLAVGARDGTLTLWPITPAIPRDPERIRVRLEWLTGQELDEAGLVHDLSRRPAREAPGEHPQTRRVPIGMVMKRRQFGRSPRAMVDAHGEHGRPAGASAGRRFANIVECAASSCVAQSGRLSSIPSRSNSRHIAPRPKKLDLNRDSPSPSGISRQWRGTTHELS